MSAPRRRVPSERGSALIVALIFLLALGLILGSIASFARGSVTTSINLTTQRGLELNAANAVTAAIANERYSYDTNVYSTTSTDCLPGGTLLTGNPFYVYCLGTVAARSLRTREVQFYACTTSSSCIGTSSAVALYADVYFDDVPPGATPAGYTNCSSLSAHSTCGVQMNVAAWDVKLADS